MPRQYYANIAMTYEEIGSELGMSAQQVKAVFNRGMDKLRQHPERLALIRELVIYKQQLRRPRARSLGED